MRSNTHSTKVHSASPSPARKQKMEPTAYPSQNTSANHTAPLQRLRLLHPLRKALRMRLPPLLLRQENSKLHRHYPRNLRSPPTRNSPPSPENNHHQYPLINLPSHPPAFQTPHIPHPQPHHLPNKPKHKHPHPPHCHRRPPLHRRPPTPRLAPTHQNHPIRRLRRPRPGPSPPAPRSPRG
ncbi:hypothetical protein CC80DRAFT_185337 [Byssothecium circinans]|uniref:Uncharacterized protein n=1 Tax=Byssothecium circinans TaxID=147558 RepID=A0A6A5TSY4_9PLEO|nr:hypothetical protein CC80DRAFT_185337 [Byssothecium circinans]